jgi:asparagine synthase (glutamine-hydrolysing)
MCGIAGYVGESPAAVRCVERMTAALAHRGPDGEGVKVVARNEDGLAVLGHRRLAVLDLSSASAQPMLDPAGYAVTFNGEIYNYRELRHDLAARGHSFQSRGDTEVVLRGYAEWGDDVLQHLRGIFALAIYDSSRRRLLLARDRLGVKPLYLWRRGRQIAFASEVRALLSARLFAPEVSQRAVAGFLALGAVQDPATIVRDVESLPPGHQASWSNGTLHVRPYWSLAREAASRDPAAGDVREALLEAVRIQLVSDRPLGVFLSGGLDSTVVAALVRQAGVVPRTVTVVFPGAEYSEGPIAALVAKTLGAQHHEIAVDERRMMVAVPAALAAMDQPSIDGINTFIVAGAAREAGLTVALSGLGGDELFGGYPSFRRARLLKLGMRLPVGLRRAAAGVASPWSDRRDATRKLAAFLSRGAGATAPYLAVRELFTVDEREHLLPDFDPAPAVYAGADDLARFDDFTRTSLLELGYYTENMLLRDTDAMSMAHGLEVRVPLLDERLATLVLGLPRRAKVRGGGLKPLLVAAVGPMLPDVVRRRPKQGFYLPFAEWLRGPLHGEIEATLTDRASCAGLDGFQRSATWAAFLRGRTSWHRPWALYVLERWVRRHVVDVPNIGDELPLRSSAGVA